MIFRRVVIFSLTLVLAMIASRRVEAGVDYTGESARDPFSDFSLPPEPEPEPEKPAVTEEAIQQLDLQGILIGGDKPKAIISGRIVQIGSTLSAGKVENISKDSVSVIYNGKSYILRLKERKFNAKAKSETPSKPTGSGSASKSGAAPRRASGSPVGGGVT